jgi:hypothetical protein
MDRQQSLDSLHLDDNQVIDQDVDTKACLQASVAVGNGKRHLTVHSVAARLKLVGDALLINRFEQARSQYAVNGNSRIDHLMSYRVMFGRQRNDLGVLVSWWFFYPWFAVPA